MRRSLFSACAWACLVACGQPHATQLEVRGSYRDCPAPPGITVQPLVQQLGGEIQLGVRTSDAQLAPMSVLWVESEGRGRFADESGAETVFTCNSVGKTTLTLIPLGTPACRSSSSIDVECVPAQLCGNQQLDEGEACDGQLGPNGALPHGTACTADCASLLDTCYVCEAARCRELPDAGVDVVGACYDVAPEREQRCLGFVRCARASGCAFGPRGIVDCYCGSAELEACERGEGPDGRCRTELEAAAESAVAADVLRALANPARLPGIAAGLIACDQTACAAPCFP